MSLKIDRNNIPPAGELMPFNFPRFKRFVCENGVKVLLVENSNLPLVNFELCFKISPLLEKPEIVGLSSLMVNLMSEGTTSRSSEKIANELEYYGIEYFANTDWESIHFSLSCLSKHTSNAFDIFADIIQNPIFPIEEVQRVKSERIANRQRVVDNIGTVVAEQFTKTLYGDFRYGMPLRGTIDSLENIKREDIIDFYNKYFSLDGAVLFVTGDINEQKVKELVKKYLIKNSDSAVRENPTFSYNNGKSSKVRIVHKEGAQQSEIKIGHIGVERKSPDHYKILMLNQLLGGYFLSRLNMNLRQDKGFTYGISSAFVTRGYTGPFSITSAVQSEHSAEAINEIINELRLVTAELVSDEELSNAKGYYSGVFPIAFETSYQVLFGLSTIESNGFDDDYFRNFKDRINEVSKEDILEVAKKYLQPDNLIIVIGGDRKIIEKQLSNKYDIEVYDLYGKILS